MKIKNITLKHGLILAPMAGVTDFSMRRICREMGAELTVTEMLSAKAIHYGDEKTATLAKFEKEDKPVAIQIFGSEPEIMAEAAAKLTERFSPDIIDINMGCPVHKVVSNGEGSALMKNPELAARITEAVVKAIDIPVTVKIRAGWDAGSINAPHMAKMLEEAGCSAVAVHGRTKAQMYEPHACDLSVIKEVKNAVNIPVIGNGDIFSAQDALRMFKETGCDAIMPARGAYGNPWLFNEIACALEGKPYTPPSAEQRIAMARKHLEMMIEDKGEYTGIREARKHMAMYIKGMRECTGAKVAINYANTKDEVFSILSELKNHNCEP